MVHNKTIIHRISYLIGHLKGVKKMVEDDAYCMDIINQNLGVISALKKVNEQLLQSHVKTCVADALKSHDAADKAKKLEELEFVLHRMS